jgi:hypothetical protein
MRTGCAFDPPVLDAGGLRQRIDPGAAREAMDLLEGREALRLSFEHGWIKATWMPVGFFVFPGRFVADRWRTILRAMQTIAASIEHGAVRAPELR